MNKLNQLLLLKVFFVFIFQFSVNGQAVNAEKGNASNSSTVSAPDITFKIGGGPAVWDYIVIQFPPGATLSDNGEGEYSISNMPSVFGRYQITFSVPDGNWTNGVTTADISMIQRHILGNGNLANELKMRAADVNCDGKISAQDMVEIRRLLLGKISKFRCMTNYVFGPALLEFDWLGTPIHFDEVIAVKMGDMNGSAAYNSPGKPE